MLGPEETQLWTEIKHLLGTAAVVAGAPNTSKSDNRIIMIDLYNVCP